MPVTQPHVTIARAYYHKSTTTFHVYREHRPGIGTIKHYIPRVDTGAIDWDQWRKIGTTPPASVEVQITILR